MKPSRIERGSPPMGRGEGPGFPPSMKRGTVTPTPRELLPAYNRVLSGAGMDLTRRVWLCRRPLTEHQPPRREERQPSAQPILGSHSMGMFAKDGIHGLQEGRWNATSGASVRGRAHVHHPPTSCVTLGQIQNPFAPRFPHLKGGVK